MVPPPGSKAAKQEAFQREHPTAYVVRRTAWAGFEILIGLLGISALLGGLLPRLDLVWLPRPGLPDWLPELSKPEWLRYLDITYWLGRLGLSRPDIGVPGWAEAVLERKKYWLPLVVAALVALGQLERRRKIDAERAEQERGNGRRPALGRLFLAGRLEHQHEVVVVLLGAGDDGLAR